MLTDAGYSPSRLKPTSFAHWGPIAGRYSGVDVAVAGRQNGLFTRHRPGFLPEDSVPLLPIPIGSLLALDATRRPGHGREAFWADRLVALDAVPKLPSWIRRNAAFTSRSRLESRSTFRIAISSFRRVLNLIYLIRALFDGNVVPVSQYPSELGLFWFEDLLERLRLGM